MEGEESKLKPVNLRQPSQAAWRRKDQKQGLVQVNKEERWANPLNHWNIDVKKPGIIDEERRKPGALV